MCHAALHDAVEMNKSTILEYVSAYGDITKNIPAKQMLDNLTDEDYTFLTPALIDNTTQFFRTNLMCVEKINRTAENHYTSCNLKKLADLSTRFAHILTQTFLQRHGLSRSSDRLNKRQRVLMTIVTAVAVSVNNAFHHDQSIGLDRNDVDYVRETITSNELLMNLPIPILYKADRDTVMLGCFAGYEFVTGQLAHDAFIEHDITTFETLKALVA